MDISVADSPFFKSMDPPEPLHQNQRLRWDHPVNLIGEKVVDPLIHCCDKCDLPILLYGRLISCKHVFCLDCANKAKNICPRCGDKAHRIDQSALGTVFVCTYGSSKHDKTACRKTYLSVRDLQAHIEHRHLKKAEVPKAPTTPVDPRSADPRSGAPGHNPDFQTPGNRSNPPQIPSPMVYQNQPVTAQMMAAMNLTPQNMIQNPAMVAASQGQQQVMMSSNPAMISPQAMMSQPGMMPPRLLYPPVQLQPQDGIARTPTSNLITVPIADENAQTNQVIYPGLVTQAGLRFPPPFRPNTNVAPPVMMTHTQFPPQRMPPRLPQQTVISPPGPPTSQMYQTAGNRFPTSQHLHTDHSVTPPYQGGPQSRPQWPPRGHPPRGPPPRGMPPNARGPRPMQSFY